MLFKNEIDVFILDFLTNNKQFPIKEKDYYVLNQVEMINQLNNCLLKNNNCFLPTKIYFLNYKLSL